MENYRNRKSEQVRKKSSKSKESGRNKWKATGIEEGGRYERFVIKFACCKRVEEEKDICQST